jgi:hypothetical protein
MIRAARITALALLPFAPTATAQNAAPSSFVQPTAEPAPAPAASRIELHTNPLLSLHMLARAGAAGADVPEVVRPAVDAMLASGSDVPWAVTDGTFASADNIERVRDVMQGMSNRFTPEVSEQIMAYLDAFAAAQPAFRADLWPDHERIITESSAALSDALAAHGPSCIARMCELLGMTDPGKTIPVFLVAAAPSPGGFTALSRAHGAVCIVSAESHRGSALTEATLHEAIHALDTHTRQQQPPSVLHSLRKALADAGIAPTDALMRDVPHTLIFAVAAHVTRTSVDASHVPYGDTGGYYAKVPEARDAVLPAFTRYVAGEIGAAELVAEIVKGATKAE